MPEAVVLDGYTTEWFAGILGGNAADLYKCRTKSGANPDRRPRSTLYNVHDIAAPVVTHEITELFSMGIGGLQRLKLVGTSIVVLSIRRTAGRGSYRG